MAEVKVRVLGVWLNESDVERLRALAELGTRSAVDEALGNNGHSWSKLGALNSILGRKLWDNQGPNEELIEKICEKFEEAKKKAEELEEMLKKEL